MADLPYDAILLVSFGGPEGPDDVIPFLENVTRGRGIPRERLAVVGEHYAHFGGVSPINEQCRRQRRALETALAETGMNLPVYWGNRNWDPYLADEIERMAEDGITRALAVFTSAYSSYSGCRQYRENIIAAREEAAERRPDLTIPAIDKVRAYYDHPGFIEPFVEATKTAIAELGDGAEPTLVFTAHSIPMSMASTSDYEAQLAEAARLVAERVAAPAPPFTLVWQSRSGPPQVPWLEPDVNDELIRLAEAGVDAAVIVPVGFISDHIEVMWDLDAEAAATAADVGIRLARAVAPGTGPDDAFVAMWVDLVRERIDAERGAEPARAALGSLEIRPDVCRVDCCPAPQRPAGRPGGAGGRPA
ncbi:MAG: ferrochelatase [Actinomycetota bacterium]